MEKKEKSYYMLYRGDIESAFENNGIDRYVILNDKLASIYVDLDFDESILDDIKEINWWSISGNMSSLIEITDDLKNGETATDAAGTIYIENNPYINVTGKGILIAVIDSGVSYLHRDLINKDNESKIMYLWDQESDLGEPPEGLKFGSEYTNEDLNEAIKENNETLSIDETGTGTMVCGMLVGEGNIVKEYQGIAKDAKLVVVKLRGYENVYYNGKISYTESDFLAAITYVTRIAEEQNLPMIINMTVGTKSNIRIEASIIESYKDLQKSGMVLVSGAGNEGNTDIHYGNKILIENEYQDVIIQNGDNKNLDIILSGTGPDKIGIQIISPSGDVSQIVKYSPDDPIYKGRFYIEGTNYKIVYRYPWLESGEEALEIELLDIKPGVWTLRLLPEFIIHGNYDLYLPNKNLISKDTRFLDPTSIGTITEFALSRDVITIGAYNGKTNSLWIGSSKGGVTAHRVNPDLIAPGVDIISTYNDGLYNTATGTGVSSSIVSGALALIMEYLKQQSQLPKLSLFTDVLRTYLVQGAIRDEIYEYPNISQGYGIMDLRNTFRAIARNL
ncbi:bile acid germinant receptor pseudoprotease CspC [Paraclostridium bifermentans]|uniref:bile acid germinant receptor pseudoprotease CspC n=1 Tax=Paraclostridium bifermentans TaxID=1490 RepID=UPI00359C4D84